jgi:hypothetical protein
MYDEEAMADRIRELESRNTPKPKPLRSYRGVVYRDDHWESHGQRWAGTNVYEALCYFFSNPTDDDFAGMLAVRDNPYEPVETLEDVIKRARNEWWNSDDASSDGLTHYIARTVQAWMDAQVPTVDEPAVMGGHMPPMPDLVDELKRAGWKELRGSDGLSEAFNELYKCSRILVLPSTTHNNGGATT